MLKGKLAVAGKNLRELRGREGERERCIKWFKTATSVMGKLLVKSLNEKVNAKMIFSCLNKCHNLATS